MDPSAFFTPEIFVFAQSITFLGITLWCIHGCKGGQVRENGWQRHLGRRVVNLGGVCFIIRIYSLSLGV
jgi:hypothetical protein